MSATTSTPTILVVTSRADEAERLVMSLRQGGLAVRGAHAADTEGIEAAVTRGACDLIICCCYDAKDTLDTVLHKHRDLEGDVPLLLIADPDSDRTQMILALRSGARDVSERDDMEHLQCVVSRELEDLRQRRKVRQLMQRLQQCEERGRELIETTGDAVAFIQDGIHVSANPAYLALFGYPSLDELQAAPFLDLIGPGGRAQVRDLLRNPGLRRQGGTPELAITCARADSSEFSARLRASQSEIDGEPCLRVILRPFVGRSTSEAAAEPAEIPQDAPGCSALVQEIETRIGADRMARQPFVLFFIRIRGFARLFGDIGLSRSLAALDELGSSLSSLIGTVGFLARAGDQGYGLIIDGLDEPGAARLAKRIRSDVHLPLLGPAKDPSEPNCDVGYVVLAGRTADPLDILDTAFRMSARASGAGSMEATGTQKPTSLASRSKQLSEDGDAAMAERIEHALQHDRFMLVYQPMVSLMGDNQENYSVLIRLLDEQENLLEAKDFIGPSIRTGLIERIDKWAIRQAIRTVGEKRKAGHSLNFFINLAEDTFRNPGIILWICDCLREFDVRGNWLTFQFQEELVAANLASLNKLVEGLKKIKCRVAINRFGALDRPEMLFQGLPLDFVLLLPELAQGLADDKDKQRRLLLHASLAREFNVKSVVTGVEDARALTILWTAGVDYVQGNFLQRPSPALELHS